MEPGGPGSQLAQAEALFRPPLHEVHVSHPLSQAASECQMDEDQTDETATDFTDLSVQTIMHLYLLKVLLVEYLWCNCFSVSRALFFYGVLLATWLLHLLDYMCLT